eukprot:GHVT01024018.1.p2 GENE.GHVT01024018.1~~GHVT01024018.1.p2  ORF type:complete len:170 (+),score=16.51 GHVT01024018.1:188-697(+)
MSTSTFDSSDTTGRTSSSVPSSVSSLPSVTLSSQGKGSKGPTRRFFRSPLAVGLAGSVLNAALFTACFLIAFRCMNSDEIGGSLTAKTFSVDQEDANSENLTNYEGDPNESVPNELVPFVSPALEYEDTPSYNARLKKQSKSMKVFAVLAAFAIVALISIPTIAIALAR